MSLHLGNLSPHIQKDELERVFWRFGRCTVQLKDGYGFAVFDFWGDAEKALRALKGRKICGELIYLSWSNKQPKPLQSFSRAGKFHDMQYERKSGGVDDYVSRNFSRSRGDYPINKKPPDDGGARLKTAEVHDRSFNHHNVELEHHHQKEGFFEEDAYIEPNQVDNNRWGEQVDKLQNVNGAYEETGFDRYEPDCPDEREEYENCNLENTEGSPSGETLLDKRNRVRHAHSVRGKYTCFKCGAAGHKMRDCLSKDALYGKSLHCSGHRHDNKTDSRSRERTDVGGPDSRYRGSLQPSSRSSRSARQLDANGKPSSSERDGDDDRSSSIGNAPKRTKTKDYNRKRQRERDNEIVEMSDGKTSTRLTLSHPHSNPTSPQLGTYPKSVRPSPDSIYRSRSGSPVQYSLSAKSRSKTRSNQRRSKTIKSKSRSGGLPSSSFSSSLCRSLPSSPNKEEVNLNSSFDGAPNPQFKEKLTEVWQESEPEMREEKTSTGSKAEAGLSGYIDNSSCRTEPSIEWQQLELDLKDENATSINHAEVSLNGSLDGQIPHSQELLVERQQLEPESRKNLPQIGDMPGQSEDLSSALEVGDDSKMNGLHNDNDSSSIVPNVSCEIKIPFPSVEQGDRDTAAKQPSAQELREVEELENGNCAEIPKSLEPGYESVSKATSCVSSEMRISAEELCMILKHYGLKHPEEDEQKLGVEDYFGSARLWPWALIYYRRLKKGCFSAENYARQVAQNKALGISDKYIRSSSGWGE